MNTRPAPPTPPDLLVLHTLRCIGFVGAGRLADTVGMPEHTAESELIDLAVAGLVTYEAGPFSAWGLTEAGRAAGAERITAELDATGARPAVTDALHRFLVLNPELLEICSAWQLRHVGGVPVNNDHTDPAYDARVLDLLTDLHRRVTPVCSDLAAGLARFARYRVRLADTLVRARAGDRNYVTDGVSSYHAVWSQLHEDLLVTLGLPRWTGTR